MSVAIDPVCLMEVELAEAAAVSEYNGQTYYFCAPGCKVAFDEEPERYLEAIAQASRASESERETRPAPAVAEPSHSNGEIAVGIRIAMPVDVAIRTRRSVARLKPDAVPREAIVQMLEAAVWAPNHHLTEPWEFVVLTGDSRRRFAEIRRDFRRTLFKNPEAPEIQPALNKIYADTLTTPVIIIVNTTNPLDLELRDDDYGATMCAIQNMLLVATGLGLGVYLRTGGLIRFAPLLEFLEVPPARRIAGVVYVGYPALIPRRNRTPYEKKTRWMV